MPTPHRLSRRLNEILGPGAADAMVDWMNQADGNISDFRRELSEFRQETRADFAEVRQEVHAEFARLREEMTTGLSSVRADMTTGLSSTREEMRVGFARVDAQFAAMDTAAAKRHADFLKWMVAFWLVSLTTLVGSIAAFARMLR
jgi:hypothetical protein